MSTHLQTAKFSFSFKGKKLLVCVGNDVTLQHQMMEQLKNALDKAEQADRLKAQFISNMSHEIRTPLNAIVGFSQLIADATSKEEQEEYQRIVMLNNNLLLTLIEDVLNLSVVESNGNGHVAVLAHAGAFGRHRSSRSGSGKNRTDDAGEKLKFHKTLLIEWVDFLSLTRKAISDSVRPKKA